MIYQCQSPPVILVREDIPYSDEIELNSCGLIISLISKGADQAVLTKNSAPGRGIGNFLKYFHFGRNFLLTIRMRIRNKSETAVTMNDVQFVL